MASYALKLYLGHPCVKSLDCTLSHLVYVMMELCESFHSFFLGSILLVVDSVVELNNLYPSLKLLHENDEIFRQRYVQKLPTAQIGLCSISYNIT